MSKEFEQIIGILKKSEVELQELIAKAANTGDYRMVDLAKTAAVGIQSLQTRITNPGARVQPRPASSGAKPKGKSASRRRGKARYPRFEVKKNSLIRIGWSKKDRREYTHKTPRVAFDRTVKAMAALAQNGAGPFTAEEIIEQVNHMESETIPSYQIYVVIGLLRVRKCIVQVGREGYNIPQDILDRISYTWRDLTERRANKVRS